MIKRISIALAILSVAASAAVAGAAGSLTDLVQSSRMTVLKVDQAAGQFMCAEHGAWTTVTRGDLKRVAPGDIVRLDTPSGGRPRLALLRSAADELTTPER